MTTAHFLEYPVEWLINNEWQEVSLRFDDRPDAPKASVRDLDGIVTPVELGESWRSALQSNDDFGARPTFSLRSRYCIEFII